MQLKLEFEWAFTVRLDEVNEEGSADTDENNGDNSIWKYSTEPGGLNVGSYISRKRGKRQRHVRI
jgi:hypothetical protein